jgi:mycofactocin precursor
VIVDSREDAVASEVLEAEQAEVVAEQPEEVEEVLVEEISIDGMCGVY